MNYQRFESDPPVLGWPLVIKFQAKTQSLKKLNMIDKMIEEDDKMRNMHNIISMS